MGERDVHCHRHHKHRHSSSGAGQHEEERPRDERKLVNKIASIDIWATERLYKNLRHQSIADRSNSRPLPSNGPKRQVLLNYNATQQVCKGHDDNYIRGKNSRSLVQPANAKLMAKSTVIGEDTRHAPRCECHRQRRARSRTDGSPRNDSREHRRQYLRHLSQASSETASGSNHHYLHKATRMLHSREPEKAGNIESGQSTWESSAAAGCVQRGIGSNGRMATVAPQMAMVRPIKQDTAQQAADLSNGCIACQDVSRRRRQCDKDSCRKQCSANRPGQSCQCYATKPGPIRDSHNRKTVDAFCSPDQQRTSALPFMRLNDRRLHGDTQISKSQTVNAIRLSSKSNQQHQVDITQLERHRSVYPGPYSKAKAKTVSPMHNQSSGGNNGLETHGRTSYSSRIAQQGCKSDARPAGQVERQSKPVIWLIAKQPSTGIAFHSQSDSSTAQKNEFVDKQRLLKKDSNATVASRRLEEASIQTREQYRSAMRQAPGEAAEASRIGCNNSKSLQMQSTATSERDIEAQDSGWVDSATITKVKLPKCFTVAKCAAPQIRMQSNAAAAKDDSGEDTSPSEEDFEEFIQVQQEVGESESVEPKTGSVSRFVQDEVLKAAMLVATRGFAGLVGARNRDELGTGTDLNSTETAGTDTVVDDSDDDLDSLELALLDLDNDDQGSESADDDERKHSRHEKGKKKKKRGDEMRGSTSSMTAFEAEHKLLPMTACPTTQHRIECFRTRSGKVRCYMTARHPVKCHMDEGGRIQCRATANPEVSDLPFPCNAAWQ